MTPDEIRAVANAVMAGTCNDEHVALALGMVKTSWRSSTGKALWATPEEARIARRQKRAIVGSVTLPPFLTSIDACAAEIACRNWIWDKSWQVHPKRGLELYMKVREFGARGAALTDGTPSGDARALCVALLRAFAEYKEKNQDEVVARVKGAKGD